MMFLPRAVFVEELMQGDVVILPQATADGLTQEMEVHDIIVNIKGVRLVLAPVKGTPILPLEQMLPSGTPAILKSRIK